MSTTRVLVADDHTVVRKGVCQLLERQQDIVVVAEAADGEEAVRLAEELAPDVVVMDVGMPKLNGLEATKRIKTTHPGIAILVLTIHDDDQYVIELLNAGAAGYLLKTSYGTELVQAIRAVGSGDYVLHPTVGRRLLERAVLRPSRPAKLEGKETLTGREVEVLKLAARGLNNQAIAQKLGISLRTVKGHLANIFSKMRVGSRGEAVFHGLKMGLLSLEDIP